LLLAATGRSFAPMPLGISDRNTLPSSRYSDETVAVSQNVFMDSKVKPLENLIFQ